MGALMSFWKPTPNFKMTSNLLLTGGLIWSIPLKIRALLKFCAQFISMLENCGINLQIKFGVAHEPVAAQFEYKKTRNI
jgi:hypothetical protein